MDHLKNALEAFLGLATLANLCKLIVVGFSILPAVMTVISAVAATTWYVLQIRAHLRAKKTVNDHA